MLTLEYSQALSRMREQAKSHGLFEIYVYDEHCFQKSWTPTDSEVCFVPNENTGFGDCHSQAQRFVFANAATMKMEMFACNIVNPFGNVIFHVVVLSEDPIKKQWMVNSLVRGLGKRMLFTDWATCNRPYNICRAKVRPDNIGRFFDIWDAVIEKTFVKDTHLKYRKAVAAQNTAES